MNRIIEDDQFWSKMIYKVCEGNAANMRELKKMDIFEFFEFIENCKKNAENRTDTNNITGKSNRRNP